MPVDEGCPGVDRGFFGQREEVLDEVVVAGELGVGVGEDGVEGAAGGVARAEVGGEEGYYEGGVWGLGRHFGL